METKTKRIVAAGLVTACVATALAGVSLLKKETAFADEGQDKNIASTFFYDGLVTEEGSEYTLAKKFYKALGEMYAQGDFKDGKVEYNITDRQIVTSDEVKDWVENGELTVPKAFSAARDAFLTDHPEIFYIDFYKLTISAGRNNGVYSAYIDTGREANAYYDEGFTTQSAVNKAVNEFNKKVDYIVNEALAAQAKDAYSAKDVFLARYVNKYIAENTKYDYVAYENRNDKNYVAAANISTAYGSLVEGKAICGGFSTAYKVVMDKLGVPCLTVNGYGKSKDEQGNSNPNSVYHMWNYVYLETPATEEAEKTTASSSRDAETGRWYSVDVTWNSNTSGKLKYAILDRSTDDVFHETDGVISSSKYELKYPALSDRFYGSTGETEGIQSVRIYEPVAGEKDDYGNQLYSNYVTVSYNGKSAKKLFEEDGLYLVCRFATLYDGELYWGKWLALEPFRHYAELAVDNFLGNFQDNDKETRFSDNTQIYFTQCAVFDAAPDVRHHVHSDTHGIDKDFYFEYSDDILNINDPVKMGDCVVNKTYGTYTPAPFILTSNPNCKTEQLISDSMAAKDAQVVSEKHAQIYEFTYDEPLHILDDSKPIGISFVSDHPNAQKYARFYDLPGKPGVKAEIVAVDENKSMIRFKFGPSLMYEHNREGYHISFTNVGSAKKVSKLVDGKLTQVTSDKIPNPAYISFGRAIMACPARFHYDGRLWVECCAQPVLADNSDLSATDFKKEDGTSSFSENERSQMMLVAEKATDETVSTMKSEITGSDKIGLDEADIQKSETYDITLQVCHKFPTIPDGSYVKIMLGFPEGYGPESEGVRFKLFHRKHDIATDTYSIEEVPCVVTKFGIVATVTSFSPYMVAAVNEAKVTDKTVAASINGKGGKLNAEDGKVRSLKEGESYTYTVAPDKGYQLYTVTLNGKNVTDKVENGKLTLNYADIENSNELEIKYIANGAVKRVMDNNLVSPVKVVVNNDNTTTTVSEVISTPDYLKIIVEDNGNPAVAVAIVIAVTIVVVGAAIALTIVIKKKKSNA